MTPRRLTVQVALLPDAARLLAEAAAQASMSGAHWTAEERATLAQLASLLASKVRDLIPDASPFEWVRNNDTGRMEQVRRDGQ